jgi:hypothetical protein
VLAWASVVLNELVNICFNAILDALNNFEPQTLSWGKIGEGLGRRFFCRLTAFFLCTEIFYNVLECLRMPIED